MNKSTVKKPQSETPKPTSAKSKDSFTLRIPRFKNGSLNAYLVLVLVIFAFFLGMLTNKVYDLQNQVTSMSKANPASSASGSTALPSLIPSPAKPVNVSVGHFPPRGDAKAKVTVIEFADFRCPFCEQW